MTERQPKTGAVKGASELSEALAILISSTRGRRRPLPLTQIARWLDVAVDKLGSYQAVADRIGLSTKMLRQFSYVRRLAPGVQKLFESRKLDSVDAAAHLAMLPAKEQGEVGRQLADGKIDTSDVRAVVQLRQAAPADPLPKILTKVKQGKAKREYVAEFIVRGSRDREALVAALSEYIPATGIIRLELDGALGRLVLTEAGRRDLYRAARTLGVPMKRVIPEILQD